MGKSDKNVTKIATEQNKDGTRAVVVHQEYRGLLPHPDELRAYNEIVPDAAERILAMAEQQAAHRRSLEATAIMEQLAQSRRGQVYAFITSMTALAVGGVLGYFGHDWLAGTFVTSGSVGLASIFYSAKRQQREDLERKNLPVPQQGSSEKS